MTTLPSSPRRAARPATPAVTRSALSAWISLFLFFVLGVISSADMFVFGALKTPIKDSLHLTDEQLGRIAYSLTFAGVAAAPLFSYLGDRFRRKGLIWVGLLLWTAATIGSGLAGSLTALLIWRALVGVGEAGYATLSPGWIADLFTQKWRNLAFGVIGSIGQVGCCIGFLAGGFIAAVYNWQAAFFVAGVPGIFLAVVFLFVREPAPGEAEGMALPRRRPALREGLTLLRETDFVVYLIGVSAYYVALSTLSGWGPVYLHRAFGLTNRAATAFFAYGYLFWGVPGSWLGGYLGSRWRRRSFRAYHVQLGTVTLVSFSLLSTALLLNSHFLTLRLINVEIFFGGLASGAMVTLMWDIVPLPLRNSATAIRTIAYSGISSFLSSILVGLISDHAGIHLALFVAPLAFLVSSVSWWLLLAHSYARGTESIKPPPEFSHLAGAVAAETIEA